MDSPFRHELQVAIRAVQAATKISRHVLLDSNKGEIQKADLTPVTVADYAIQAVLTHSLHCAFPEDGLVGEESAGELLTNPALVQHMWTVIQHCASSDLDNKTTNHSANAASVDPWPPSPSSLASLISLCETTTPSGADSGRVWVFDPIDGTKTFLKGQQYAINVALLIGGRQILSVVCCPLLDSAATGPITNAALDPKGEDGGCILFAVKGYGAFVRPVRGGFGDVEVKKLERHADGVTVDGLRSVTCWRDLDSTLEGINEASTTALGVEYPGCDLVGWVPRWAVLALGLANMTVWVYKRGRHGKIWDHAGAMLLFEEVGGMITDVNGRDIDLTQGRKFTSNFGFVAAPRSVHHVVLQAVRDTLRAHGKGDMLR